MPGHAPPPFFHPSRLGSGQPEDPAWRQEMGSGTALDLESSPYHMLCSKAGGGVGHPRSALSSLKKQISPWAACRRGPREYETEALPPLGSGHGWQALDPTSILWAKLLGTGLHPQKCNGLL